MGGLAYKAFQSWKANQSDSVDEPGVPIGELPDNRAQARSLGLLRAMMAAARADGNVDVQEQARIHAQVQALDLDPETLSTVLEQIDRPADAKSIAQGADSPAAAAEMYLVSLLVIDEANPTERGYLDELSRELGLSPALVNELEKQTRETQ